MHRASLYIFIGEILFLIPTKLPHPSIRYVIYEMMPQEWVSKEPLNKIYYLVCDILFHVNTEITEVIWTSYACPEVVFGRVFG